MEHVGDLRRLRRTTGDTGQTSQVTGDRCGGRWAVDRRLLARIQELRRRFGIVGAA